MTQSIIDLLINGVLETLYMVIVSTALAYVFGLPLGIILYITDKRKREIDKFNTQVPKYIFNITFQ